MVLATVVDVFGEQPENHAGLASLMQQAFEITMKSPLEQTYPDAVTALFVLATHLLISCHNTLIPIHHDQNTVLFALMDVSLSCLHPQNCTGRDTTTAVLGFWSELMALCGKKSTFMSIDRIYQYAERVCHLVIMGLTGVLPDIISQEALADTLHQLLQHHDQSQHWLAASLQSAELTARCSELRPEEVNQICTTLWHMRQASKRMFRSVVKDASRIFCGFGTLDTLVSYQIRYNSSSRFSSSS